MYKLANENIKKGDLISFFIEKNQNFAKKNQYSKLKNVLTGTEIFNIENIANTKGTLVRAAGCKAKLMRKYKKNGLIILPSKEKKIISLNNFVSIGQVSNSLKILKKDYKAGNSRLKNIRPKVRGVAMNPIDHPHGGGEGKSSGGRHSVSK
jgi:large subunit ribosomal protein L2